MKRTHIILLSLIPLFAMAQEPQIIGGHMEDRIFFPVYLKTSFTRSNSEEPLTKWGANIGIEVMGIERK